MVLDTKKVIKEKLEFWGKNYILVIGSKVWNMMISNYYIKNDFSKAKHINYNFY